MGNPTAERNRSVFACIGKVAHDTPAIAAKIARKMSRGGKRVESYRCPTCQLWHVGRDGKKIMNRPKRKPRQFEADGALDPWDALSGFRVNR